MFAFSRNMALAIVFAVAVVVSILLAFIPASFSHTGNSTDGVVNRESSGSFMGRRLQAERTSEGSEQEKHTQEQDKPKYKEVCSNCSCSGEEIGHDYIMVGGGPSIRAEGTFYANLEVIHSVERCYEAVQKHSGCGKSHFRYSRSSNGFSNCKCRKPCASRCAPVAFTDKHSWTSVLFTLDEDGPEKDDDTCFNVADRCTDTIDFSRDVRDVAFAAHRTDPNSTDAKLMWDGNKKVRYEGPYYEWEYVPSKPRIREVCHNVKELGFCDTTDGRAGCRETCGRCERNVRNEKGLARQDAKEEAREVARESKREEKNSERDVAKEEKKSFRDELRQDKKQFYEKLDALAGAWEEVDSAHDSEKGFKVSLEFPYTSCYKEKHDCGEYYYQNIYMRGRLQLRTDPACPMEKGKEICRYEFTECRDKKLWKNERCSSTGKWIELVIEDDSRATWIQHNDDNSETSSCILNKMAVATTEKQEKKQEEKKLRIWDVYMDKMEKEKDLEDGEGPWKGGEPLACIDWWPMGDKSTEEMCADYKALDLCKFQEVNDPFSVCRKTCGTCA